jgi:hypothetical protein
MRGSPFFILIYFCRRNICISMDSTPLLFKRGWGKNRTMNPMVFYQHERAFPEKQDNNDTTCGYPAGCSGSEGFGCNFPKKEEKVAGFPSLQDASD